MSAPKHTAGQPVFVLKRSHAFPFIAAKRQQLTPDLLRSIAERNGSGIDRVAVWLIEGFTVATDFCAYELEAPAARAKATGESAS